MRTRALLRRYGRAASGTAAVDPLVDKYMAMLGIVGERPIVKVTSKLGAGWLGRDRWSSRNPHTTTLELQRSILPDARTLERVVAHEMIHHRDMLALTENEIELAKFGIKPESHGADFLQGAQIINAAMGPGFVTVESDKEYVQAPHGKELYVLIEPMSPGSPRLGWSWAARLSPEAQAIVAEKMARGARLVRTTDLKWTQSRAKIKQFGGMSLPPPGSEKEAELRALYESAP